MENECDTSRAVHTLRSAHFSPSVTHRLSSGDSSIRYFSTSGVSPRAAWSGRAIDSAVAVAASDTAKRKIHFMLCGVTDIPMRDLTVETFLNVTAEL